MADLLIYITTMGRNSGGSTTYIGGVCRTADMSDKDPSLFWEVEVNPDDTAEAINTVIKNAAISVVTADGGVVTELDKKTIIGGAIDV